MTIKFWHVQIFTFSATWKNNTWECFANNASTEERKHKEARQGSPTEQTKNEKDGRMQKFYAACACIQFTLEKEHKKICYGPYPFAFSSSFAFVTFFTMLSGWSGNSDVTLVSHVSSMLVTNFSLQVTIIHQLHLFSTFIQWNPC